MLISGISFETSSAALIDQIPPALSVFADAVEKFLQVPANQVSLSFIFCDVKALHKNGQQFSWTIFYFLQTNFH